MHAVFAHRCSWRRRRTGRAANKGRQNQSAFAANAVECSGVPRKKGLLSVPPSSLTLLLSDPYLLRALQLMQLSYELAEKALLPCSEKQAPALCAASSCSPSNINRTSNAKFDATPLLPLLVAEEGPPPAGMRLKRRSAEKTNDKAWRVSRTNAVHPPANLSGLI